MVRHHSTRTCQCGMCHLSPICTRFSMVRSRSHTHFVARLDYIQRRQRKIYSGTLQEYHRQLAKTTVAITIVTKLRVSTTSRTISPTSTALLKSATAITTIKSKVNALKLMSTAAVVLTVMSVILVTCGLVSSTAILRTHYYDSISF